MHFCTLSCEFDTVNLSVHAMKAYRRGDVELCSFPTSALHKDKQFLTSHPSCCTPTYQQNRRLGGPKASRDTLKKKKISCPCQNSKPQ